MTVFFLTVGLEIKRELLVGELSSVRKALLPFIAACGGMIVPVAIYTFICPANTDAGHGLAIPMATDIAFSLGVLSLLGKRVPLSLKIFLTAFAVVDDIGGIMVIAAFYSKHVSLGYLAWAAVLLLMLFLIGKRVSTNNFLHADWNCNLVSLFAIGHTQYHCRRIACLRDTRSSTSGCRKIH